MSTQLNQITHTLSQYFGFEQFRTGQQQTIEQLLNGHSTLSIFPTGSGKSLCYQLTALHLPNLTLVVSPLLALMKDQLDFLTSKGISAASLDSTLTPEQYQQIMSDVRANKIKILMVSVERFKNERFRQFIQTVAISMLVVDEAHCISEWGHNFRPDYLKLPSYRKQLNIPLVLLLTATATKKVKLDMAAKFSIKLEHIVQTGFYRQNLDLAVIAVQESEKNASLVQHISPKVQAGQAGIVYVTQQHTAEQIAAFLQKKHINAQAYHAGMDNDKRKQIQLDYMNDKIAVVVATIAFGMGVDKANIRFVIHYDLAKSIENYSQEIGRAGRDGAPATCITLANLDGLNTVENFVYGDTPELEGIEYVLANIQQNMQQNIHSQTQIQRWEMQINELSNASNIRQLPLKTLLVQLELIGAIKPLYSYFAEFKLKFLVDKNDILSRFNQARQDFLNQLFEHTTFKKVWGEVNFDSLYRAYQADRTRVIAALEYLNEQGLIELQTRLMTDVYGINPTELSQPQLAVNLHDYFVDKANKEIKRIAALIRFFELDKCLSVNLARYFDDQAVPEHCGHCSVCRGHPVKLDYSQAPNWPSDQQISASLTELQQFLASKTQQTISTDSYCRFLAGINVPLFSRYRVKKLSGFGLCENLRYAQIKAHISNLLVQ